MPSFINKPNNKNIIYYPLILLLLLCLISLGYANSMRYNSPPNIPAKSWLIMDYKTKRIISGKNINQRLPPASTTKMMSAYVIGTLIKQHKISFSSRIKISKNAANTNGSKMILRPGMRLTVRSLLKGLLVTSGNDAAVALAEGSAGSVKNFAKLMNKEAKKLGLKNTHFVNPNGLPAKGHYSSAKDLAIIARALIKDMPNIYKTCSTKNIRWNKTIRKNTNKLLWKHLGVDGVKTGYTNSAKFCLVSSAVQHKHRIITVILGANTLAQRFSLSEKLIKYAFKAY